MTFSIIGTGNIAWFFGNRLLTGRQVLLVMLQEFTVVTQTFPEVNCFLISTVIVLPPLETMFIPRGTVQL